MTPTLKSIQTEFKVRVRVLVLLKYFEIGPRESGKTNMVNQPAVREEKTKRANNIYINKRAGKEREGLMTYNGPISC